MPLYSLAGRAPALPPADRCWIAPNTCLIGDVRLGPDAAVWFGAVLRGDNEPIIVGARTNNQELCTLHTDMGFPLKIGEDCTVGHNATLHGCTIADGSSCSMEPGSGGGASSGRVRW
jgi:carbonic anhydrase/acetyltransferase-like protein (isoleucine patch superfamily)